MAFQIDALPNGDSTLIVQLPIALSGDYAVAVCQDVLSKQENNIFNPSQVVYTSTLPKKISISQFEQCHITVSSGSTLFNIPVVYSLAENSKP
jgi:hypothetical protein